MNMKRKYIMTVLVALEYVEPTMERHLWAGSLEILP